MTVAGRRRSPTSRSSSSTTCLLACGTRRLDERAFSTVALGRFPRRCLSTLNAGATVISVQMNRSRCHVEARYRVVTARTGPMSQEFITRDQAPNLKHHRSHRSADSTSVASQVDRVLAGAMTKRPASQTVAGLVGLPGPTWISRGSLRWQRLRPSRLGAEPSATASAIGRPRTSLLTSQERHAHRRLNDCRRP